MKRVVALMVVIGTVIALVGCASSGTTPPSMGSGGATTAPEVKAATGLSPQEMTTAGEKAAFELAKSEKGRKWASGNAAGSSSLPAPEGEPFFVGYQVQMNDGKRTGYTALVANGKVIPWMGQLDQLKPENTLVTFDWDKSNMYNQLIAAESDAQRSAIDAAIKYVQETKNVKVTGGIETYAFSFPLANNTYPMVQIFANTKTGTFSSGSMSLYKPQTP